MRERKQSAMPLGVGILSILTTLVVLLLAVFASLSLSQARGDLRLSRSAADFTSAYYAADALACQAAEDFAAGTAQSLEQSFPISDIQQLHIALSRRPDGTVETLVWQTRSVGSEPMDSLPVWDGQSLPGEEAAQ